ncbi:hypothetical protein OAM77_05740, partial [Alphaproteobacteria bacterium]|nr:hypothetical protein [Alphaproteobacteria bacterium]
MTQITKILKDSDVVTTLLLFAIASIIYSGTGTDAKDWVFPLMACFSLFAISAFFLVKSISKIMTGKIVPDLEIDVEQIPSIINVIFFSFFIF